MGTNGGHQLLYRVNFTLYKDRVIQLVNWIAAVADRPADSHVGDYHRPGGEQHAPFSFNQLQNDCK